MSVDLDFITTRPMPFKALDKKTDYISREALLKMIGTMPSSPITDREERLIRAFISTVKNFPAADVRPVVLCRDCVYAYPYGLEIKCTKHSGKAEKFGEDASYSEFHDLNWFCADAQGRRTNERN